MNDDVSVFLDYVEAKYGGQVFDVPVEDLLGVLLDLQMQLASLGLSLPVPPGVADHVSFEPYDGDVEMLIYPSLNGPFKIAIFPVYSEV